MLWSDGRGYKACDVSGSWAMKDSGAPLLSQHPVFLVNAFVNDGHSCSSFMGLEYSSFHCPNLFSSSLPSINSVHPWGTHTEDAQMSLHYAVCHDGKVAPESNSITKGKCLANGVIAYQRIASPKHASQGRAYGGQLPFFWVSLTLTRQLSIQSNENTCHSQSGFSHLAEDVEFP